MRRHAARVNRTGLALLGLVLALAGAALACQSFGVFGQHDATQPLYPPAAQRYVHQHAWIWSAAAAAAIILGLIFLRWLLVQTRRDVLRRVPLDHHHSDRAGGGHTLLLSSAVTDIVEDQVGAVPGVRRVSANLAGSPDQPELWVAAVCDTNTDLAQVRTQFTGRTLPECRGSLEQPALPGYLTITIRRRNSRQRLDGRPVPVLAPITPPANARSEPGPRPNSDTSTSAT